MTLRERVIVETYTGTCMVTGEDREELYKYWAELMGRPVYTHEIASKEVQEKLEEMSKGDFIALCRSDGGAKKPVEKFTACCPVCKNELYDKQPYCDRCGQKLGWEE